MTTDNPIEAAIDAAEELRDPLDRLVEKTAIDPGAPFAPDVLERLATLKKDDRRAFESLRVQLKEAGCRVTALDEAIAKENGGMGRRDPTQADILIDLAQSAELFHAPDGTGFADFDINDHRETWPIRAKGFRRWLARRFFEATQGAPSSEAMQSALNVIEAMAHFDAPERVVHIRVGGLDGRLYLDLVDDAWRAVEIDATGWRVIDRPPVRFRRAAGMKPLPIPVPGGSVETLRSFLNVRSNADFVLVVAYLLAALRDRGPYPVIALSGEQGSAKTTFSAIVRALLDPNTAPLRALPRNDRDLFIAASNGHVLAFDNVSGLPVWLSDTLCRLATGGGFAVRQLYTDQNEVLFDATRPVILNGIEDFVTRPDLADRSLPLTLETIPEERRRPEAELWAAFEAGRPRIFGALLDVVSHGVRMLPHTRLDRLPRMADFALWATACETALWPAGTFMAAYAGNRDEAIGMAVEGDVVTAAIRTMMTGRTEEWVGTSSELLALLTSAVGESICRSKLWPQTPEALRGRLKRAAPVLRQIGIRVVFGGTGRARRSVTLFPPAVDAGEPAPPAPPSPANKINGLDVPVGVTVATGLPDRPPPGERGDSSAAEETVSATDTPKSLDLRDGAGCDGGDGLFRGKSGESEYNGGGDGDGATRDYSGVPFMITAAQKAQLRRLGYSDAAIANMRPEEAHKILSHHRGVSHCGGALPPGGVIEEELEP